MKIRSTKGFTLIELLIVVAIIGIIAAIAVPGLLRARMSGNEASAIGSMRAINTAQQNYSQQCQGYAITLPELKAAGNFLPVDPTPATIESGQTPVVIDWNYLNAAVTKKLPTWQLVVPPDNAVAGYYYQAINKDAPHPAAARLWQEFLYSDEGQNLFAVGGVRPVRADNMMADGTIDKAVSDTLPIIDGPVTVPSPDQTKAASKYLADNWAKAIG